MYGELQEESSHLASSDDVTGAMSCKFKAILTYNFETERILGLPRHLFYINLVRNNETENVKGFIKKLNFHVSCWLNIFRYNETEKMQNDLEKIEMFAYLNFFTFKIMSK